MAKQYEAKVSGEVDMALTFKELQQLLDVGSKIENLELDSLDGGFDKFYNDYTKIYPLTGAVVETMHYKKLLENHESIVADGIPSLDKAIEKMETNPKIRFLDALSCVGGCIGGPAIISQNSVEEKTASIKKYREDARKDRIACDLGKIGEAPDVSFENSFLGKLK